jgi:SAM-dependent methyltransferase
VPLIDPGDIELSTLRGLSNFAGCRVVEVGAGDGRLSWPLGGEAALWVAVDNDRDELRVAVDDLRANPLASLRLLEAEGQALGLAAASFDAVVFSWSLCCVPRAGMAGALAEARRVLRPGGQLLDVHPTADPRRLEAWIANQANVARSEPEVSDYQRALLGHLREHENPHDFRGASGAIDAASGLFILEERTVFDYPYFFDDLNALTEYLEDNDELALASDEMLERALLALSKATTPGWLVLIQPVVATRLRAR